MREISNSIVKEHTLTFGVNFAPLALLELVWQMIHVIFPTEKSAKYSTQWLLKQLNPLQSENSH